MSDKRIEPRPSPEDLEIVVDVLFGKSETIFHTKRLPDSGERNSYKLEGNPILRAGFRVRIFSSQGGEPKQVKDMRIYGADCDYVAGYSSDL